MKMLLDTDVGSDIDDAVCLAYLLANQACDLVGITTVSGQPVERAKLASALCRAAGRPDIPIVPGAEAPLAGQQRQPDAKQASVLPRWPHATRFPAAAAETFMADTIRENGGEVTLLAIGPMTNVARLLDRHPEVCDQLSGLMLMSGRFGPKPADARSDHEWNVFCDPAAAELVYRAPVASHRSVGLDVTLRVQMEEQAVRQRFSAHLGLLPVLDMSSVWFREGRLMTFHDPLAAVCLFDRLVCDFTRGRVEVDVPSGVTRWAADKAGPHEVALSVDAGRFFDAYFSVFQAPGGR